MKQVILGTAGHIDHGKTSFVKAISGIDTDRLKEEKLRGITIELGFAFIDLPNGQHVGIVDVPGHERFIKNMVAGATGIDLVAMIIAADEGVMPQTVEHLDICSLLGIRYGLIVLTKIDLVDNEWLELVTEDIKKFVKGTFLENAPIIPVSSVTGKGISEFITALEALTSKIPEKPSSSLFRLPVDRVFTMKGFGTVITGTLISGQVHVGDTIMIYPSKITSKVRGIQVHNQSVDTAYSGMRTAINFQGLEKESVNRGDVVSTPDALVPSFMIDGAIHFLKSNPKPMKNRMRIRFHAGTAEVLGNIILLDTDELAPGENAIVQLRLDTPVALVKDDRFVIRSYSPVRTLGGGSVLNPIPQKHKRFKPDIIKGLQELNSQHMDKIISYHIQTSGFQGLSFANLKIMTNLDDKPLQDSLQHLLSTKIILLADRENRIFIHYSVFDDLKQTIKNLIETYHKTNPLKSGMPKEEIKSKLVSPVSPKLFNLVIGHMVKEQLIVQEEDIVRLITHKVALEANQVDIRIKILKAYQTSGLEPPYFKDLINQLGIDLEQAKAVLGLLLDEGILIKIKDDLFFYADTLNQLKQKTIDFLMKHGEMTTSQFKSIANVSRKYLIPLIEYFDAKNITIRVGDVRKLRMK